MNDDETLADRNIREAEHTIQTEAAELERVKKLFFMQPPDDRVDDEPLVPALPPAPPTRRRKPRQFPEIDALARFAKAVEQMSPPARRAAIGWLADKYLGIRLRGAVSNEIFAVVPADDIGQEAITRGKTSS
jgi:hypothetical protein